MAEWQQALQQLEYLFYLTVAVDAKNLAIENVEAHKKNTPFAEPFDTVKRMHAADDNELIEIADRDVAMAEVPMEADVPDDVVLPMTDQASLLR